MSMLRTPQHVTPDDHPDCIVFVEGDTFEQFLLNADDLCQRDNHRLMLWQNPDPSGIGRTAISETSSIFNVVRRRTHRFFANKEMAHFDGKIRSAQLDPQLLFDGRGLRIPEQLYGDSGTSLYYLDPRHAEHPTIQEAMTPGRKSLEVTPGKPAYDLLEGPFTLSAGQAAILLTKVFGNKATAHGYALPYPGTSERETLLTDIAPIAARRNNDVNTPSSETGCSPEFPSAHLAAP